MKENRLLSMLELYNPWWSDGKWYREDPLIRAFEESTLRKEPRLYYHIRKNITASQTYGIITIRGPRRVGKTTLIKLIIKYLIEHERVNPKTIFYISLDYEGLRDVELTELLSAIARTSNLDKYVFLDEASMYPRWAQALKNMYDANLITKGKMKMIAAGSHSMDLAEAASKLRGRQGRLAQLFNVGGNLIHVPLRFPEVVEALRGEMDVFLSQRKFRRAGSRFRILQELASGTIPSVIQDIYDNYFQLLQRVFEDYLIHGGYPRAIDEYHRNGSIGNDFYSDVAELLIKDSERAGLYPENLKRLVEVLIEPKRLSATISFRDLEVVGYDEDARPKKKFRLRDYLDYLRTTWTFFFTAREEGRHGSCRPNLQEHVKNYVLDPFIYHALYAYLHNIPDPFNYSVKLVGDEAFRGRLVESVVASHLLLSQQLFERIQSVDYTNVLLYQPSATSGSDEERETDFVLCIKKGADHYRFTIESKYRRSPSHVLPQKGKIVLTRDVLRIKNNTVFIPVSLFLLLF